MGSIVRSAPVGDNIDPEYAGPTFSNGQDRAITQVTTALSSMLLVLPEEVVTALSEVVTTKSIYQKVLHKVDILAVNYMKQGILSPLVLEVLWGAYTPATCQLLKELVVNIFRIACADSAGGIIVPYLFPQTDVRFESTPEDVLFSCTYFFGMDITFSFLAQLFVQLYKHAQFLPNEQSSYLFLRKNDESSACRLRCENCWVVVIVKQGTVELIVDSRPPKGTYFVDAVAIILKCVVAVATAHKAPRSSISWKCTNKGCEEEVKRDTIPIQQADLLCDVCYTQISEGQNKGKEPQANIDLFILRHSLVTSKERRSTTFATGICVLFATSNPPGTQPTLSDRVLREIQVIVPLYHEPAVTWQSLQLRCEELKPTILHLWAHGELREGTCGIVLSDNDQLYLDVQKDMDHYLLFPDQLAALIKKTKTVGLLLLSACYSADIVKEVYAENPNCKCIGFNEEVSPHFMERWFIGFYNALRCTPPPFDLLEFYKCVKKALRYLKEHPWFKDINKQREAYSQFKAALVVLPALPANTSAFLRM